MRLVIDRMIPAVAGEGLAEWCDVFCEQGVFTPDESTRILQAGAARGLKPRIHADEAQKLEEKRFNEEKAALTKELTANKAHAQKVIICCLAVFGCVAGHSLPTMPRCSLFAMLGFLR